MFLARRQYTDISIPSNNNNLLVEGQSTIKIKVEAYRLVPLERSDTTSSHRVKESLEGAFGFEK